MRNTFRKKNTLQVWHLIFIVIGIGATLGLIISLFVVIRPGKAELYSSVPLSAREGTVLRALEPLSTSPAIVGGDISILNNGDEFYPALFQDIQDAKESIFFTAYIVKEGPERDALFSQLTQKAQEGVAVRLLLDGFGAKGVPKEAIEALEKAGGKVAWYHPLRFGTLSKYHKRNHARAIVIDESIGYIGGMGIAPYWSGNAQDKDHWRDMMFRLSGAQTTHLIKSFAMLWEVASGEVLVLKEDTSSEAGDETLRSVSLTSISPSEDVEELSTYLAVSIRGAQESVNIVTPYFVLENRVEEAILDAQKRGVKVTILLPGPVTDSKVVQSATQRYYARLLKAGVSIYEYQPTMIHTKFLVVDGVWSLVGSANIDTRSTFFNVENVVGIESAPFATLLTETFEKDIGLSKQVTLEEWKKRSPFRMLFEILASLVDKQL